MNKEFGKYISQVRKAKGFSVDEFKKLIDFDIEDIVLLEKGEYYPDIEEWLKIKKLLEITDEEVEVFFMDEKERSKLTNISNFKNQKIINAQMHTRQAYNALKKSFVEIQEDLKNILNEIESSDNNISKGEDKNG